MPPQSEEVKERESKEAEMINKSVENKSCRCHQKDMNKNNKKGIKSLFEGPGVERDACGVGFLVDMNGNPSSSLLRQAETMSARMEHRGACSCDNLTGDGAGVMTSIPHELYYERLLTESSVTLPALGKYGTGLVFLDPSSMTAAMNLFERMAARIGLKVLAWSSPPTNDECLGSVARNSEPLIKQVFLVESSSSSQEMNGKEEEEADERISSVALDNQNLDFEQKIYFLRFDFPSFLLIPFIITSVSLLLLLLQVPSLPFSR